VSEVVRYNGSPADHITDQHRDAYHCFAAMAPVFRREPPPFIKLHTLDTELTPSPRAMKAALLTAMRRHVLPDAIGDGSL
jgi:hypothetical protein